MGDRSQYGINIAQGGANGGTPRSYGKVIAHKVFKTKTGETSTLVMTADEIALTVTGQSYTKPPNVTPNSSEKSLSMPLTEDIQIVDQATFAVILNPPVTTISEAEGSIQSKFIDVYLPNEHGNLKHYRSLKVYPDFDISVDPMNLDFNADDGIWLEKSIERTFFL
ncbi:hypothetical protein [Bacillus thuringiensis]|uniref:Uncharacterized protein n=1 Tax=Bacillus thuringiensis Bt18247 TaxID=1423143 RepID=A0A9W3XC33_BACTU|nr:hypothetical protein [Bacillus thuringiensis]AOM14298.1 hypothetical protein BTI247_59680 [Bacillus thuringiensis Bt18247]MBG9529328.1 hypothetical protein [Bacillus thuringiensis]